MGSVFLYLARTTDLGTLTRASCPVCRAWDGASSPNRQDLPAIPNPACLSARSGRNRCRCEVTEFIFPDREDERRGGPHVDENEQPDGGVGSHHFPDGGGGGWGDPVITFPDEGGGGWGDPVITFPDDEGGWGDQSYDSWGDSKSG